jgi:hypothetical protein
MNYGNSIRNLRTEPCRNDGAYVIGVGARMTLVFSYYYCRVACDSLSFINFCAMHPALSWMVVAIVSASA